MILSIITPGPTLTIYQNGKLSALEALSIIRDLAKETKI